MFGPGVRGDQPGVPTYDWNTYHHIGAFGHLEDGDVAMSDSHARRWYPGLRPRGIFLSRYDGKLHRWEDHTGSRNPDNEDVFKGASINVENHFHITGDADSVLSAIKKHSDEVGIRVHRSLRDHMATQLTA